MNQVASPLSAPPAVTGSALRWPYLALLALLGGLLVAFATPMGLNLFSGDGISYVEGARNILRGKGFCVGIPPEPMEAITHFPPGYSILIACFGHFFSDIHTAARWCNVFCFAGCVWCLAMMLYRSTGGKLTAAIFGGLLFATNATLLTMYCAPWSEAPFLFFELLASWLLIEGITSGGVACLGAAALCLGVTATIRYAGVAWLGAGGIVLLIYARGGWLQRLLKACSFGALSSLPLAVVVVRNHMVAQSAMDRSVGAHFISFSHIKDALNTVASWFLPWRFCSWPSGLIIVLALLAVAVILAAPRFRRLTEGLREPGMPLAVVLGVFIAIYTAQMILAISFVEFDTPLDDRTLAPVQVAVIALVALGAFTRRNPMVARATVAGCALLLLLGVAKSVPFLKENRVNGGGFHSPLWQNDPLVKQIAALPAQTVLYSNKSERIYLLLNRSAKLVPEKLNKHTLQANPDLERQVAAMVDDLRANHGLLVYFPPPTKDVLYGTGVNSAPLPRLHELTLKELLSIAPLSVMSEDKQLSLLRVKE